MELLEEKHKHLESRLDVLIERVNNHSGRINSLEIFRSSTDEKIENLIEQIKSLVSVMKWFIGLTFTSLVGFFIWYVQGL